MIEVEDNNEGLNLKDVIFFVDACGLYGRWEVFDLEYSGREFEEELPIAIEEKTKTGLCFSPEKFQLFVASVNQIIEGTVIFRTGKLDAPPSMSEDEAVMKILISDSAFLEIGGKKAESFIRAGRLIRLKIN